MNEQSEPTTGEIVRALRYCGSDEAKCAECEYTCIDQSGECFMQLSKVSADRLESQEQTIATLTARVEQAEAREKAIIESLRDRCEFCIGYELEESDDPCNTCYNARTFEPDDIPRTKNWTWRGLPQDGEGK